MTMLDTPDIKADFVEMDDPMGPYGNKALGEPPAIPSAPAIRNAVLHATGVAFNENPLTPQRLIDGFKKMQDLSERGRRLCMILRNTIMQKPYQRQSRF